MEEVLLSTNFERKGPSPFPVHVTLAFMEYARLREAGQDAAVLEKMLAGIRKYLLHPYRRDIASLPCVWEKGEARLLYCAADSAGAPAKTSLFLIPSLVNGAEIFDLLPERSFVRWLSRRGIESYILDWGDLAADPGARNMEGIVTGRLCAAIAFAAERSGGGIYALGYCMGGTLLAAAAMQQQEHLKGAIFLAAPWDFYAGSQKESAAIGDGVRAAAGAVAQKGFLPVSWLQSAFAAMNAERAMQKFMKFADMDSGSEEARLFVAVEDWLNQGMDMPGPVALECIRGWYGDNRPARGLWEVGGARVDPSSIAVPSLVVASGADRLVPQDSAFALARALPCAERLAPSCGHIGMMAGTKARAQFWEPLAAWISQKP